MWEWQDATWHRLNSKDASILEKAYLQDPAGCWPVTLGPHQSHYEVDFFAMKQRSRNGRIRNLRRKETPCVLEKAQQAEPIQEQEIPPALPRTEPPEPPAATQEEQEIPPAATQEQEILPVLPRTEPPEPPAATQEHNKIPPVLPQAQEPLEPPAATQAMAEATCPCNEGSGVPSHTADVAEGQQAQAEVTSQQASDFGSLSSLKRSVASGRVVLVKGSWLALAARPFSLGVADLPSRHELPPEAIWTQMDSLNETSAAQRLVAVSHCADSQEAAGTLSQLLGSTAGRQLNGETGELGVFLDTCSLERSDDGDLQFWRDTSEWLASAFTTKWLLRRDSDGLGLWERHLSTLRCSKGVFQVDVSTSVGHDLASWKVLATPQVVPDALDVLLQEKPFERLEMAKASYREAFCSLVSSQEVMDCYSCSWDDFHMLQLSEVLIHCRSLVKLILAENRVGDFGLETLSRSLPETLEILDLSGNCFGDEGLTHLARHVPTRLRQLCLSSNDFGETGMDALVRSLPQCEQLRSLHLARVPLAGASLSHLGTLKALRHLCLNEAHLGCEGVLHLSLPDALEELLLDGNGLGDAGLRILTSKLPRSLQLLSLSENGLRDSGLCRALLASNLRTLRVNSNHFSAQALHELSGVAATEVLAFNQRP